MYMYAVFRGKKNCKHRNILIIRGGGSGVICLTDTSDILETLFKWKHLHIYCLFVVLFFFFFFC